MMSYKKRIKFSIAYCLFLSILLFFLSCSGNVIKYRGKTYSDGDSITVKGFVTSVGNSPFTHYVIIDDDNVRFMLPKEWVKEKKSYNKIITVHGKIKLIEMKLVKDDRKIITKSIVEIEN